MRQVRLLTIQLIPITMLLALLTLPVRAEPFGAADFNLDQCKSWRDNDATPAPRDALMQSLGLTRREGPKWTAGRADAETTWRYLVVLRQETPLGTLFCRGPQSARILKPGIKGVPDPARAADWIALDAPPRQSAARTITLPPDTKTRAVLLSDRRQANETSQLAALRLFRERLHNETPFALAYADREYLPPNAQLAPHPAANLTRGLGHWVNVGKDNTGFIPAPPVSEIHPSWFLLSWPTERVLSGVWLDSSAEDVKVETFTGPAHVNPRAATPDEWRRVRGVKEKVEKDSRWITFEEPLRTRGLRLVFHKSAEGAVVKVNGLHVFSDCGANPVPATPPDSDEPPPFRFAAQAATEGQLTLVVNNAEGRRVRNLIARAPTKQGEQLTAWDLKDEQGNIVAPGRYRWSAVAGPDLKLRYEMTAYPDVSRHAPDNSPWINGHHDSGGWMADHTPPIAGCALGERVYLGSLVAESGISLIECDLDGRKLWGHHSFASWTGPRYLAGDGQTVYVGATVTNTNNDVVWAVDTTTKKVREVVSLKPSASRQRGLQGLAAHDGKLYLSVRAGQSWLEGAAVAEDVDAVNSVPLYPEKRKPRVANENVPDPRGDVVRLFRLAPHPPGGGMARSLEYLDTESGKGPRQHLILAFHRPVPLGSVVYPVLPEKGVKITLSVLKADAAYPPKPEREADWTPFAASGSTPWDVVPAPEGTRTRALRITFSKGTVEKDPLADLIDGPKKGDPKDLLDFGKETGNWRGRLEGMKLLRRRFVNVTPGATIRVNSGVVAADGSWDAQRSTLLTESDPGIYTLEWSEPKALRGLAIKEIDGELTRIDIKDRDGWQEVATYTQQRRDVGNGYGLGLTNPSARYVDGYVDFGREVKTSAVRLRIVKQWADKGQAGCMGVRTDRGGGTIDLKRCRVYGVAALQYVGGESPVDTTAVERIEVLDAASGKLLRELPVEKPDAVAVNPKGELFALSGKNIVRVDADTRTRSVLVSDLVEPTCFTFDRQGTLYVYDGGKERRNVRVYNAEGKYTRSIGKPGGFQAGPWDPERVGAVTALAVDGRDQLWLVENQYYPKRVAVWTCAGKFVKELLGNTPYGGGGVLDPLDRSRLFYGPLEFELDWKTGLSRIRHLLWTGATPPGEVPIRFRDRTYLVTRPLFAEQQIGVVYRYEKDRVVMAAAMGLADHFEPLKQPELIEKLGGKSLPEQRFLWTDRNGDGAVQADEVALSPRPKDTYGLTNFNRDLGIQSGSVRYSVKEVLPNGVPVYEMKELSGLSGRHLYRLDDGTFFRMGTGKEPQTLLDRAGKPIWTFPQEGDGVQALHNAKPWRADQVVAQFGIVGHEKIEGGLGEVVVLHGNSGAWNVWTRDGLLVGPIFRDQRAPGARPWSMKEHNRGMTPEGLTAGEEHFAGYFCRCDDRYYVVAGHNHISVLEVLGLDKYQRSEGEITVTEEDVRKARSWDALRQKREVYARSPVLNVFVTKQPPAFDGKLTGFGPVDAALDEGASLRIGYDARYLYLGWQLNQLGPLQNSGRDWQRLFKTGGALDVQLGLDLADRQAPAAGDVRLLLTFVDKKTMAVLYRPVVPGTPADKAFRVVSPVGETVIDEVRQLEGVRLVRGGENGQVIVEAAIPLAALGLKPSPGLRLKADWGVLVSGPDGTEVLRRVYWANRATQIVADAPSEARLSPHLWGHLVFHGQRSAAEERIGDINPERTPKDVGKDVTDILDDLKTRPPKKP